MTEERIELIVENLLENYWSGTIPVNPIAIACAFDIDVVDDDELNVKNSFCISETKCIHVKKSLSASDKRYAIAQELGRILLGLHDSFRDAADPESSLEVFPEEDALARQFARALLLPEVALKRHGYASKEERDAYNVPFEAMYVRLHDKHVFLAVELGVSPSLIKLGVVRR